MDLCRTYQVHPNTSAARVKKDGDKVSLQLFYISGPERYAFSQAQMHFACMHTRLVHHFGLFPLAYKVL